LDVGSNLVTHLAAADPAAAKVKAQAKLRARTTSVPTTHDEPCCSGEWARSSEPGRLPRCKPNMSFAEGPMATPLCSHGSGPAGPRPESHDTPNPLRGLQPNGSHNGHPPALLNLAGTPDRPHRCQGCEGPRRRRLHGRSNHDAQNVMAPGGGIRRGRQAGAPSEGTKREYQARGHQSWGHQARGHQTSGQSPRKIWDGSRRAGPPALR
jgi:hypothetical protein